MTPKAKKSAYDTIVEQELFRTPVSKCLPALNIIAREWNLKLSHKKDWDIAVKILINSVKYN